MKKIAHLAISGVETLTPLEMNAIHFSIGMHTDLSASAPAVAKAEADPVVKSAATAPHKKSLKDL